MPRFMHVGEGRSGIHGHERTGSMVEIHAMGALPGGATHPSCSVSLAMSSILPLAHPRGSHHIHSLDANTACALSALRTLTIIDEPLTDMVPSELGSMPSLEALTLKRTSLFGRIPTQIGMITTLQALDLSDNSFAGYIPTELARSKPLGTGLRDIDLSRSTISGIIPTEIAQMRDLTSLILDSTRLSSSLPSEIGRLSELQRLNVGNTLMEGEFPDVPDLFRVLHGSRVQLGHRAVHMQR